MKNNSGLFCFIKNMKKLVFIVIATLSGHMFGQQQLPNSSFENWTMSSNSTLELDGWYSVNMFTTDYPTIFSVYPNLASDIVSLNVNTANNTNLTVNIYNMMGSLIKTEILKQNRQQMNISDLSNGIYVVEIKSKDWTDKQKLLIQR